MAISKNFAEQVSKREKPSCFSKYTENTKTKEGKKKCGMCWFSPYCKDGKFPAGVKPKTVEKKTTTATKES